MTTWKVLPRSAGLLTVILLAVACAGTTPTLRPPISSTDWSGHEEIFAAGYRGISEKYIEPVPVSDIAVGGLEGFSSIDPALQATRAGATIRLLLNGEQIHSMPAPAADDPRGWAVLTAAFEKNAKARSPLMRKASDEKVYEAVFDGVLSDLDVFSRYAGAEEARRNRARRDGFGGIGIRFKLVGGKPIITSVMPETPAANVALQVNDEITHIDGVALLNAKTLDVVKKLRGPTNSEVRLRIYRRTSDRTINVAMERSHIVPSTVTASLQGGISLLKISSFNQGTARSVAKELRKAKRTRGGKLKGLVIDLRGNPGGLLKQSVKVADLLLTHGHILSTRGRHPDSLHHYEAGGRDLLGGLPTAVLIDGKSASASEIVAAALQDRGRAVIIGTSSFGKGTVQTVIRLPNDGEVTLTWSRFLTPSGYVLHGLGVRPVICSTDQASGYDQLIRKTVRQGPKSRAIFASWRTTGVDDKAARQTLRGSCASVRRKGKAEMEIASILLADQDLYQQAIDITATLSQAQK